MKDGALLQSTKKQVKAPSNEKVFSNYTPKILVVNEVLHC